MARSTVSDVAIMARRLGQVLWPWDGIDAGWGKRTRYYLNPGKITRHHSSIRIHIEGQFTKMFLYSGERGRQTRLRLVEFDRRLFGPNMGGDLDLGSLAGISRTLNLIISFRHHKSIDVVLHNIFSAINSGNAFIPGLNDLSYYAPPCSARVTLIIPVLTAGGIVFLLQISIWKELPRLAKPSEYFTDHLRILYLPKASTQQGSHCTFYPAWRHL